MAASGLLMALWLTLHMLAIQLVFAPPELMNGYALKLRATGLLWPMRLGLIALLLVHVAGALATSGRSLAARPVRYAAGARALASTAASRTMRTGGLLLALYLVYHVAQMYGFGHAAFVGGDVHHNLVSVLRSPLHASLYSAAALLIALHLAHGLESSLRSLGVFDVTSERRLARALKCWAWAVAAGFAAPSIAFTFVL
jgi:succinate dehydrogenase / fumarate reductase cytochrome b subunit